MVSAELAVFLPVSWNVTTAGSEEEPALIQQRRIRAQIAAEISHHPKWEPTYEIIDELIDWGINPQWPGGRTDMVTAGHFIPR